MSTSSLSPLEKARKIEGLFRLRAEDKGRRHLRKIFNCSDSCASKFMAGDKDDSKYNIVSISKLLESLDLKLVPADAKIIPVGHVAVLAELAIAGISYSRMGLDQVEKNMIDQGFIKTNED